MTKIFLFDLFETDDKKKILYKLFFQVINIFLTYFILEILKNFHGLIFLKKYSNLFFYLTCLFVSFFTDYKVMRINNDVLIRKNFFYKMLFLLCNFIFSFSGTIFLSFIILQRNSLTIKYIFLFFSLFYSINLFLCFKTSVLIKILIFLVDSSCLFFQSYIAFFVQIILKIFLFHYFQKNCFCFENFNKINTNLISQHVDKNKRITAVLFETFFLIREKKKYVFFSTMLFFITIAFFILIKFVNTELFNNPNDFKFLLFVSLNSGAFCTIIGPYMINWIYFYTDDILSKNTTIIDIIQGKYDFLRLTTFLFFICSIPFIFLINMDFFMMGYFFFMNSSVSILVAFSINLVELSKVDYSVNPRKKSERGSLIAGYIPWICEFFSIIFYQILMIKIPSFWIMFISICIFVFVSMMIQKIIEKISILIFYKIEKINLYERGEE